MHKKFVFQLCITTIKKTYADLLLASSPLAPPYALGYTNHVLRGKAPAQKQIETYRNGVYDDEHEEILRGFWPPLLRDEHAQQRLLRRSGNGTPPARPALSAKPQHGKQPKTYRNGVYSHEHEEIF